MSQHSCCSLWLKRVWSSLSASLLLSVLFDFSVQPPAVSDCLILYVKQTSPAVSLWDTSNLCGWLTADWLLWLKILPSASWQRARLGHNVFTLTSSLSLRSHSVCVSVSFYVPLGTLLNLGFGSDPASGVRQGSCCEAVGGWRGQFEDFGWVGSLDVVHSSNLSHPPPRVSAVCQVHFPLKVNIASPQCYRTLECQLGAKPSYMWLSIIAWDIAS